MPYEHMRTALEQFERLAKQFREEQEASSDTEQTSDVEKVKVPTDWAERKSHELGRLGVTLASLAKQGHTKLFKETWYQATTSTRRKKSSTTTYSTTAGNNV